MSDNKGRRVAYQNFVDDLTQSLRNSRESLEAFRKEDWGNFIRLAHEAADAAETSGRERRGEIIHFSQRASKLAAAIAYLQQWIANSFASIEYIGSYHTDFDLFAFDNLLASLDSSRTRFIALAESELGGSIGR